MNGDLHNGRLVGCRIVHLSNAMQGLELSKMTGIDCIRTHAYVHQRPHAWQG